jgi:hypothetical protein
VLGMIWFQFGQPFLVRSFRHGGYYTNIFIWEDVVGLLRFCVYVAGTNG